MPDVNAKARQGNTLGDIALKYAERGIAVFAVTADGKAPSISNEKWAAYLGRPVPKGQGGLHQASTDPDNLRWQFSQRGSGGIAMPCGERNGVIVADFDIHKEPGKVGNANDRLRQYWDEIHETQTVTTRNGGLHVYFKWEPGHGKYELGDNIEVQSDGAYVLLPPSKGYRWGPRVEREDWPVPPWPGVPTQKMTRERSETISTGELVEMQRHLAEGNWHNTIRDMVAHLVMTGWADYEILGMARQWTLPGYDVGQTLDEVYEFVASARAKWGSRPQQVREEDRMRRWMDDFMSFDKALRRQAIDWAEDKAND